MMIEVKQEHIDGADFHSCEDCAVARALNDATGDEWNVGTYTADAISKGWFELPDHVALKIEKAAEQQRAQKPITMKPFRFRLKGWRAT